LKGDLKRELDDLKNKLLVVLADERILLNNKRRLKKGQKYSELEIREEIKNLRLREQVLNSSLEIINSKYDAKVVAINEFKGEERELREYLDILKEENFGLKHKIRAVQDALDRLK
jgi:hypothetical protein